MMINEESYLGLDRDAVDSIETQQTVIYLWSTLSHTVTLCVSLSFCFYKALCAVCRDCWLPLATVATQPLWSDFIASGTLIPWLTMNKTNRHFLLTQVCICIAFKTF